MDSGRDASPVLELEAVTKRFGTVTAVDRLTLSVLPGEFVTLLGPSGCGKTTALRMIAGFEEADEGALRFRGEDVTRFTPQRRGFGMVFQNYALFPHLSVAENVAFGLRARKRPADEIRRRVEAALERVDLPGYGERAVQALSGGQQQRIALARALAIEPPLLLLDEPLSNLDAALRERTRTEIRRLVKELGITALFVTHDQEEAFDLSDRIAVMSAGRLRQMGTPGELYGDPADLFVAGFVGRANFIEVRRENDRVHLPGGAVWEGVRPAPGSGSGQVVLMVRPEDLHFSTADVENALPGVVLDRRFRGALTGYVVETESTGILELSGGAGGGPAVGETVRVAPRPGAALHLFATREG
jgi:ABC-type Fe3+/spermidine/putrescine transport system ATPase subunit